MANNYDGYSDDDALVMELPPDPTEKEAANTPALAPSLEKLPPVLPRVVAKPAAAAAVAAPKQGVKREREQPVARPPAPPPASRPPPPSSFHKKPGGGNFFKRPGTAAAAKKPAAAARGLAEVSEEIKNLQKCMDEQEIQQDVPMPLDDWQQAAVAAAEAGSSFYLTGPAGSGKSLTIKTIVRRSLRAGKCVYVTASTGVAASNVGGMTLHFCLGLGIGKPPYKPYNMEAIERMQNMDLLVIDEISMISNIMLDGINVLLRQVRNRYDEEFGGVQVIVVGDFGQLPPIDDGGKQETFHNSHKSHHEKHEGPVIDMNISAELNALYHQYLAPANARITHCFASATWKRVFLNSFIQLRTIYRQLTDDGYIRILQEIRDGKPTPESVEALRTRLVGKHFAPNGHGKYELPDEYVVLYARHRPADAYNTNKLHNIVMDRGNIYPSADFAIRDALREKINQFCQLPQELHLKVGCRVMLKKNCATSAGELCLVNGSMGTVVGFAQCFVVENSTKLFRPVEGAVMGHAVRKIDYTINAYTESYTPPLDPKVCAGTTMNDIHLREGARLESFCPRKIFNKLCRDEEHMIECSKNGTGVLPGPDKSVTEDSSTADWSLLPRDKRNPLMDTVFYPLPVVQFDNGEIVVIPPHKWSIEETVRKHETAAEKKARGANGNAMSKSVLVKRVLVSRWQLPLILAWSISIHACVSGPTLLHTEGEGLPRMSELGKDVPAGTFEPANIQVKSRSGTETATQIFHGNVEEGIRITTEAGYELEGSMRHPVLVCTPSGEEVWKKLPEVVVGDQIMMRIGTKSETNQHPSTKPFLDSHGTEQLNVPTSVTDETCYILGTLTSHILYKLMLVIPNKMRLFMDWCGLTHTNPYCNPDAIPWAVRRNRLSAQAAFLSGLYDALGVINESGLHLDILAERLAADVQVLLANLGIIAQRQPMVNSSNCNIYRITISGGNMHLFRELVGFRVQAKQVELLDHCPTVVDDSPISPTMMDRVICEPVTKIARVQIELYDIYVPNNHSFVADAFINHNSQGLTIRNLCVDVGSSIFDAGQAYVALSRAVNLQGLIIQDLDIESLRKVDLNVAAFYALLRKKESAGLGRPFAHMGTPGEAADESSKKRKRQEEEEDDDDGER